MTISKFTKINLPRRLSQAVYQANISKFPEVNNFYVMSKELKKIACLPDSFKQPKWSTYSMFWIVLPGGNIYN